MEKYIEYIVNKFKDKKFAKTYIIVAGIVLALLLALYLVPEKSVSPTLEEEQSSDYKNNKSSSTPTTVPTQTLSYSDALKLYVDRRIQFDENCLVNPSYVTFKKGTKIMLDNRASKPRQVYLDGQQYSLKAYGFRIITLTTSAKLPHTIAIDCGNGKNNGRILLQR